MKSQIFVIEDDWSLDLTVVHRFAQDHYRAYDFLCKREAELDWQGPKRVCYFRADSLETLRHTHGNWFGTNLIVVDGPGMA